MVSCPQENHSPFPSSPPGKGRERELCHSVLGLDSVWVPCLKGLAGRRGGARRVLGISHPDLSIVCSLLSLVCEVPGGHSGLSCFYECRGRTKCCLDGLPCLAIVTAQRRMTTGAAHQSTSQGCIPNKPQAGMGFEPRSNSLLATLGLWVLSHREVFGPPPPR